MYQAEVEPTHQAPGSVAPDEVRVLCAAMLRLAIMDLYLAGPNDNVTKKHEAQADARAWFDSRTSGVSFDFCCEVLDMNPEIVRTKVERARRTPSLRPAILQVLKNYGSRPYKGRRGQ